SDAKAENYDFSVLLSNVPPAPEEPAGQKRKRGKQPAPAATTAAPTAEHVVVVRVYDRAENEATAKTVVR
ncbi:MAG TPA: hypothetical protein VFB76_03345, partial [Candidatus Angelobacter sp.]|nr:hypothetical protein [Candidatus Angelobacter sp.]